MSFLKRTYDSIFGAGEAAVTVPPLDGALLPNDALDQAELVATAAAADNLVRDGERCFFSSGAELFRLDLADGVTSAGRFDAPISALAADGKGALAIALSGKGLVIRGGKHEGRRPSGLPEADAACITALAFDGPDKLFLAVGSSQNRPEDWARDLMERNHLGSVWQVDLTTGAARRIADKLGWPAGLLVRKGAGLVVSEAWRHRLIALDDQGRISVLLDNLPAYPSRLDGGEGGLWLSLFAPRRQLIEFVLREPAFRRKMLKEIDPAHWMAPALSSGKSFLEPLQGGSVKQLGVLKPWAPSRSYGLLVRLNEAFLPEASFHSRADGTRHGITSSLEIGGRVLVTSKGGGAVLSIAADDNRREVA